MTFLRATRRIRPSYLHIAFCILRDCSALRRHTGSCPSCPSSHIFSNTRALYCGTFPRPIIASLSPCRAQFSGCIKNLGRCPTYPVTFTMVSLKFICWIFLPVCATVVNAATLSPESRGQQIDGVAVINDLRNTLQSVWIDVRLYLVFLLFSKKSRLMAQKL
jgi:hypothetical protein